MLSPRPGRAATGVHTSAAEMPAGPMVTGNAADSTGTPSPTAVDTAVDTAVRRLT
nr:hypothetical protein [Streptomyces alanosinicus]